MKKSSQYLIVLILSVLAISSCRKPDPIPGPRGPQGPQGEMGPGAFMWEIENVNFFAPNYSYGWQTPFELFDDEKVLVYIRWEETVIGNQLTDVWRLLPVLEFMDNGNLLQYTNDFTYDDVTFYLKFTDESTLNNTFTQGNIFRVVVIPTPFVERLSGEGIDYNDYNQVEKMFNVIKNPIRR